MLSHQKKHLCQQADIKADDIAKAHKGEFEKRNAMEATQTTLPSSRSDYIPAAIVPVRKPPQPKEAKHKAPLQDTNSNIRKLSGAKTDNSILTEGLNIKKALARKKKAHHVPLLANTLKVKKNVAIATPDVCTTPIAPVQDENKTSSKPTAYHMVNEFPSEYFQLPELAIPKLSAGSPLESLNGFNPEFSFEGHQAFASSADLFSMSPPSASTVVAAETPLPSFHTIEDFQPNIASKTISGLLAPAPEFPKMLGTDLIASTTIETSMTTTVEQPTVLDMKNVVAGQRHPSGHIRSSSSKAPTTATEADFLALTYPNIYAAALGRPSDTLTPKLVAWARAAAVAAYNDEAQREYAAAISDVEGLHLSSDDLETDIAVKLDEIDVDEFHLEIAATSLNSGNHDEMLPLVDGPPNSPASEPTETSSSNSEYGNIYQWNQPSEHRVFISGQNGHCRVVGATEPLYDVKIIDENSDCNSIVSSDIRLTSPPEGSSKTVPLLSEDYGSDEEASSSNSAESVIHTTYEVFGRHRATASAEDDGAVLDWDDLTASSVESVHGQKWLVLTAPPTPSPPNSSTAPTAAIGDQDWLVLTPSFTVLRSEMTNTSLPSNQSPSSTPEPAPLKHKGAPLSDDDLPDPETAEVLQADDIPTKAASSSAPTVSPEWTSDLVQTMLGTESLFTFLSVLHVSGDGSTTKSALVTTFIALVASERTKLDLPNLPAHCTPSTVMGSKILPHTIVLGTTSLATFLAQFDFGTGDVVEAEQIYGVFKNLCKEETRKNMLATTGMMGALGRRLGKLPSS